MNKRSRGILVGLLVVALLALGLLWWLRGGELPGRGSAAPDRIGNSTAGLSEAATREPQTADAGPEADTAPGAITAVTPPPSLPLPLPDVPVRDFYDDLLERARRGDARAACRLASELQRCEQWRAMDQMSDSMEERAAMVDNEQRRDRMIDAVARMQTMRDDSAVRCAGLGEIQLDQAFALQMQAARSRPDLRVWAVANPALDTRFFLDDFEQWNEYRSVAMPWLEGAAAQGDIAAIILLARIHGDERHPGPQHPPFRQIDPERFLVYADLLQRYGIQIDPVQRSADETRAELDPAALARAQQRSAELFDPTVAASVDPARLPDAMRRTYRSGPEPAECE